MGTVSKEMYFFELLVHDVLQAERLVPSVGEDVKGNLAAYREREAIVKELLSQHLHEGGANTVLLGPTSVSHVAPEEGNPKYVVVSLEVFAFLISTRIQV